MATPFHLTATTTTPNQTVTITQLTVSAASSIDWGDSQIDPLPAGSTTALTHTYAVAGTYPIVVANGELITTVWLTSAALGGLNTAELAANVVTFFVVTNIRSSTIRSQDMTLWRPLYWDVYNMPVGGTYELSSAHMVNWRPYEWGLYSMPAGTYSIDSADMVNWRPNNWYLYSMPAAGTYSINSADMVDWRPSYWRLFNMPTGSYAFAESCMRAWTNVRNIRCDGLSLTVEVVDRILADIYAGKATYTRDAPLLNIGGNNDTPSGMYQAASPPVTGLEMAYDLVHGTYLSAGPEWTVTWNNARRLPAVAGGFVLAGQDANLLLYRLLVAAGAFELTGADAGLLVGHLLNAGQGAFALAMGEAWLRSRGLLRPSDRLVGGLACSDHLVGDLLVRDS